MQAEPRKLPPLLRKGNLMPTTPGVSKQELDEWVPIDYILEWFRARARKNGLANRVLLIKSETASGKSTIIPPAIYREFAQGARKGIICTQPRIITATENVNEMLKHNSWLHLGENIGWSTKHNKLRPRSFGLLSATIGTLAQQLRTMTDEEVLSQYTHILVDETHERDFQADLTLYMLKNLLLRNAERARCPFLVLMSATFDPSPFLAYFGLSLSNYIHCAGAIAGFDERWDWNSGRIVNNYILSAADVVETILREGANDPPSAADVLIFLPGKTEFGAVASALNKLNAKVASAGGRVFSLLQVDREAVQRRNRDFAWTMYVPVVEQIVVIAGKEYIPSRRVILATNVAETGLTLSNLKYVIDSGYNREVEFNPILGIRGLLTKPAPKSRVLQRRGRAGRKEIPGVFFPLYPKYIYDLLPDGQYPQMIIDDPGLIIMDLAYEQAHMKTLAGLPAQFDVNALDLLSAPTPDGLSSCVERMYTLGFLAVGEAGVTLSAMGELAGAFSMVPMESARMILSAYFWGCSVLDVVTMAAWLSMNSKEFAEDPADMAKNVNWAQMYREGLPGVVAPDNILYKMRLLIMDEFIHGVILFNALKRTITNDIKSSIVGLGEWCRRNGISYRACVEFIRVRDDLLEQMLVAGMEVFAQEEHSLANATEATFMTVVTKLKYCIYDGYRNNILLRNGNAYVTAQGVTISKPKLFREDEAALAAKSSFGFALEALPDVLVYRELGLKNRRKTNTFEVTADRVSTMSGFVSPDLTFAI